MRIFQLKPTQPERVGHVELTNNMGEKLLKAQNKENQAGLQGQTELWRGAGEKSPTAENQFFFFFFFFFTADGSRFWF